MNYFSEAPLPVKQGLLEHILERIDHFDLMDDNDYSFENVANVGRMREGTLFYYEHQEYIIYHNLGLRHVSNCLNFIISHIS